MKTLLYNPIFINPQAYYVFPRLTRYLQPDNESTSEPANYIGTIEVKVIAYGDTTLKRTYTNTDSIDLSEFKNTWIRISLFTKVGSCVLGEWKIGNVESDLPYIDPEVLASLKAVVIVGNKTNNDSDRAIVKNLVDPDNPFVISNAAYTEGSGYADKGSPYYGAFVTDGIDDLITSTKTVQEMLGGSTEFTAVSMIHLISPGQDVGGVAYTNYIRTSDNYWTTNRVSNTDKTGIYGYSFKQGTPTVINNILGDKNDYTTEKSNIVSDGSVSDLFRANFSVEGFEHVINGAVHASSVAWYWTVIANKVLTTDQINQVIAYFNLDRTLNPDILCNTIKQGITNENHAEFGDKLIDYSGNGRDIQLNNIAWKGDSGIGKYETDLSDTRIWTRSKEITSSPFSFSYNGLSGWILFANTELTNSTDIPSFKIKVSGLEGKSKLWYRYLKTEDAISETTVVLENGTHELPKSYIPSDSLHDGVWIGFTVSPISEGVKEFDCDITIEVLPEYENGLVYDGVDDYSKNENIPVLTDYTYIYKRTIINIPTNATTLLKGADKTNGGAFIADYGNKWQFNFGQYNTIQGIADGINWQTVNSFNGTSINKGKNTDDSGITVAKFSNGYTSMVFYKLILYPKTISLLEINFLKNLMEKDEIIDLNNPIFIQE